MPTFGLPEDVVAVVVAGALLIIPSALLSWLFRAARVLGGGEAASAVVAGVLCGVLAGPGVLGVVQRKLHEAVFVGAVNEREALRRLNVTQAQDMAALRASDATPSALSELRAEQEAQAKPAREAAERARASRRAALDGLAVGLTAGTGLLMIGLRRLRTRGRTAPEGARADAVAGVMSALSVGTAAGAGALLLVGAGAREALLFGAASAGAWAAPGLRARRSAVEGRSLGVDAACGPAFGLSLVGAAWAAPWAVVAAIAAAAPMRRPRRGRFGRGVRRGLRVAVYGVLGPGVCAAAASRVDAHAVAQSATFWIAAVVALVAATDVRWGAAALAWRLFGGTAPRTPGWAGPARASTALLLSGVGLGMGMCALALGVTGKVRPELIAGVVIAALVTELTGGLYRAVTGLTAGGAVKRAGGRGADRSANGE